MVSPMINNPLVEILWFPLWFPLSKTNGFPYQMVMIAVAIGGPWSPTPEKPGLRAHQKVRIPVVLGW